MKLIKNIICFLCISICLLSISVRAAVVSDNDASSFVTKAEFEAYKNNVQKLIDDYNSSISSAIDGSIATYLATYDTSGGSTELLDKVFPIGFIILSNQAPTYGTWQEITDSTGRCLWVDSTKTWGTTIAQAMPRPTYTISSKFLIKSAINKGCRKTWVFTSAGNIQERSLWTTQQKNSWKLPPAKSEWR